MSKARARAISMNIVNQLADLWGVDVDTRQKTNDKADAFVLALITTSLIEELEKVREKKEQRPIITTDHTGHHAIEGLDSDCVSVDFIDQRIKELKE